MLSFTGFLILGTMLTATGAAMFCFPKQMPFSLASQIEKLEKAALKKSETKELLSIDYYVQVARDKKKHTKPSMKSKSIF